jgi:HAD superfamily hydrolase (TIGR01457 family)
MTSSKGRTSTGKTHRPLDHLSAYIIDLDGTVYLGNRLIPGVLPFFDRAAAAGKRFCFYTNNSSATPRYYAAKLRRLGVPAKAEHILTSAVATIMYLKKRNRGRRVYVLGTRSFENHLRREGFVLTDQRPDYVVLGFDKTLTYRKVERACRLILNGVAFVATHPDLVCPTPEGDIPDTGSMIAMIEAATKVRPTVIGKPHKTMLRMALDLLGAKASQTAIVGDRLYTDIKMANDHGLTSILVLSGETKRAPRKGAADLRPDYTFKRLGDLPV